MLIKHLTHQEVQESRGGEAQRIRLATHHLTGVLYVLDEPSIDFIKRR